MGKTYLIWGVDLLYLQLKIRIGGWEKYSLQNGSFQWGIITVKTSNELQGLEYEIGEHPC